MTRYTTLNLLRQIRKDEDLLAPEVEAPRTHIERHNTEYPTLVTVLMMIVGVFSLFAILMNDIDRRLNPPAPPVPEEVIAATLERIPAHLPAPRSAPARAPRRSAWEECMHLRLTWTPYTYTDCKTYSAEGKRLAHREGM